jgi:Leucine-rich repeat (LRR) protein
MLQILQPILILAAACCGVFLSTTAFKHESAVRLESFNSLEKDHAQMLYDAINKKEAREESIYGLEMAEQGVDSVGDSYSCMGMFCLDRDEYLLLESMYYALDGPNWVWQENQKYRRPWDFSQPQSSSNDPCKSSWQGLYCNADCPYGVCHIFYLNLTGYGLKGVMPSGMFNFTQLTFLYLSENQISGQIPPVRELPELYLMNLSYNALNGTIPQCLGKAKNMALLYLSNNKLSGRIPDSFTELVSIEYLYLLNNQLTGPLPQNIGNLSQLQFLNLGVNHFSGTLPQSISNLTQLTLLFLNNNSISGPYPHQLPPSLTKISLECNRLTGMVPQVFERFHNLSVLKLNDNYLTGPPPICLSTLRNLEILQLHLNQFTGPVDALFDPLVQTSLANIDLRYSSMYALTGI